MTPATFSIVAYDPEAKEWGVAVQSKFFGVGPVVPWAEAGTGAIATQAAANVSYGPRGLALLREGRTAESVAAELLATDEGRDARQLGIVDQAGRSFAYTGRLCLPYAGHVVGEGFACQGNILAGRGVVDAMAAVFQETPGRLAERLLATLEAGQAAGGDKRGQESAALVVVRAEGGYGQYTDRAVDIRVEDHPRPIAELRRLYDLHQLYFAVPEVEDELRIDADLAKEIAERLATLGYYRGRATGAWSESLERALETFHAVENFEGRLLSGRRIDRRVLRHLRLMTGGEGGGGAER